MAEPVGIDVSIDVDTTTVTVTSEEAVNVAIAPETTDVAISVVPASTIASAIGSTAYGSITATNIQTALEQLADQFYRGSTTPSGTNLGEGDLWYDTANEELFVYRQVTGGYEWHVIASAGGSSATAFTLDGGSF